jgi:hypothetical protein
MEPQDLVSLALEVMEMEVVAIVAAQAAREMEVEIMTMITRWIMVSQRIFPVVVI